MLLFAMGRDDGSGQISLDANGRGVVRWPGLKDSAYRRMVQQEFQRVGEALGGKYHVLRPFGENLVTVHPLGGCNMGDDPDCGVVNDLGQVYDPNGASDHRSAAVQPGLYAADGAIVPAALGVNPFLTITALAERIAQRITEDPAYADLFG